MQCVIYIKTAVNNKIRHREQSSKILCENVWVDNLLKSFRDVTITIDVTQDVVAMCGAGGFKLTKFHSNSQEVIASIPDENRSKSLKNLDLSSNPNSTERLLGMHWCSESNVFLKWLLPARPKVTTRQRATSSLHLDPSLFCGVLSRAASITRFNILGQTRPMIWTHDLANGRRTLYQYTNLQKIWISNQNERQTCNKTRSSFVNQLDIWSTEDSSTIPITRKKASSRNLRWEVWMRRSVVSYSVGKMEPMEKRTFYAGATIGRSLFSFKRIS